MAVGLIVSEIGRGQWWLGHSEIDCNSLKCNLGLIYINELVCILHANDVPGGGLRCPSLVLDTLHRLRQWARTHERTCLWHQRVPITSSVDFMIAYVIPAQCRCHLSTDHRFRWLITFSSVLNYTLLYVCEDMIDTPIQNLLSSSFSLIQIYAKVFKFWRFCNILGNISAWELCARAEL